MMCILWMKSLTKLKSSTCNFPPNEHIWYFQSLVRNILVTFTCYKQLLRKTVKHSFIYVYSDLVWWHQSPCHKGRLVQNTHGYSSLKLAFASPSNIVKDRIVFVIVKSLIAKGMSGKKKARDKLESCALSLLNTKGETVVSAVMGGSVIKHRGQRGKNPSLPVLPSSCSCRGFLCLLNLFVTSLFVFTKSYFTYTGYFLFSFLCLKTSCTQFSRFYTFSKW